MYLGMTSAYHQNTAVCVVNEDPNDLGGISESAVAFRFATAHDWVMLHSGSPISLVAWKLSTIEIAGWAINTLILGAG